MWCNLTVCSMPEKTQHVNGEASHQRLEINICKGLFLCVCLFNLGICCKRYTHYNTCSALKYVKIIRDEERGWRPLIPSDCIRRHVPKMLANGMYHRQRDVYLRNTQTGTDAATLTIFALPNTAVFSAAVGYLKCHWMNNFHFLKACSCSSQLLVEHQYSRTRNHP